MVLVDVLAKFRRSRWQVPLGCIKRESFACKSRKPFSLIDEISIVESKSKIFVSFFVTQPMSSLRISLRVHTSIVLFETNANRVSYDLVAKQENFSVIFFYVISFDFCSKWPVGTRHRHFHNLMLKFCFKEKVFLKKCFLIIFRHLADHSKNRKKNFLEKKVSQSFFLSDTSLYFHF